MRPNWLSWILFISLLPARAGSEPLAEVPLSLQESLERGDRSRLWKELRRIKAKDPREFAFLYAWSLHEMGKDPGALEALKKARAKFSLAGPREDLLELRILRAMGRYREAYQAAKTLVTAHPSVRSHFHFALSAQDVGEYDAFRDHLALAVEVYNRLPRATLEERLDAARAGGYGSDPQSSIPHFEKIQAEFPWMVRAHFELGEVFRRHYQTGDAALEYQRGLKIRGNSPLLLASLALVLEEEGSVSAALEKAREALEGNEATPRAWKVLARVAIRKEDWKAAEHAAQKALRKNPKDPEFLTLLAEIYEARGETQRVQELSQKVAQTNPKYALFDWTLGARAAVDRRLETAIDHFTRGLEKDPRCSGCYLKRGEVRFKQGHLALAREDFERARFLDRFMARALNYLKTLDRFETFHHSALKRGFLAVSNYGTSILTPLLTRNIDSIFDRLDLAHSQAIRGPFRVEVFANTEWMNARALGLGSTWGAGYSFGRALTFRVINSGPEADGWYKTMLHELAHSYHMEIAAPGRVPFWFTEGLATHLENRTSSQAQGVLKGAEFVDGFSTLSQLLHWWNRSDRRYLQYLEAEMLIRWIKDLRGPAGPLEFLKRFRTRQDSKKVLVDLLGKPFPALSKDFARYLKLQVAQIQAPRNFLFQPETLERRAASGDLEARGRLAVVLLETGKLQRAVDLANGGGGTWESYVRTRASAQWQEAGIEERCERELQRRPEDLSLWVDCGLGASAPKRKVWLETALAKFPASRLASEALFDLYRAEGSNSDAERVLRTATQADPGHAWAQYQLAQLAVDQGDTQEASRRLDEVLKVELFHPDILLAQARVAVLNQDLARAREFYAYFVGVQRVGLGPSRSRTDLEEAEEPGAEAKRNAPPWRWFRKVAPHERRLSAPDLKQVLEQESRPQVALLGLVDALGFEVLTWDYRAPPDSRSMLRWALHGGLGDPAATRAAQVLGLARDEAALPFLWASQQCPGSGAFGQGSCPAETEAALEALAARNQTDLSAWWTQRASGTTAADWFETSLKGRGYPIENRQGPSWIGNLVLALQEEDDWPRAYAAWKELGRRLGESPGRGTFGPQGFPDRRLDAVRQDAVQAQIRRMKEASVAARKPSPGGGS